MLKLPWWKTNPGLLDWELAALRAAGIEFRGPDPRFQRLGLIRLELKFPKGDGFLELAAVYPWYYPYFRPEVFANPGTFSRHQNPGAGNLCLLGRSTDQWELDWSLAKLLVERIPKLEQAIMETSQGRISSEEEPMGEPATVYLSYQPGSCILVDTSMAIPSGEARGMMEVVVEANALPRFRGQLIRVEGEGGRVIGAAPPASAVGKKLRFPWLRVKGISLVGGGPQVEGRLREVGVLKGPLEWSKERIGNFGIDLIGLLVSEEIQQGEYGDGWVFLARYRSEKGSDRQVILARAHRASASDFAVRIPSLNFLKRKHVLLVGLGSIGAPIAIELARSGVGKVSLVDFDFVEAASTVRWPLGLSVAGMTKTAALENFIKNNYPMTEVGAHDYRFGPPRDEGKEGQEVGRLERAATSCDVIVDATAEPGVHYLLAEVARKSGKPYVLSFLTPGGLGGLVFNTRPGSGMACWFCLQKAMYEDKSLAPPPAKEDAYLQPPGCGERTAAFPGFDAAEISLQTVRTAISLLGAGAEQNYPSCSHNLAMVSFHDGGLQVPPQWETYTLAADPQCAVCG